MRFLVIGLGSMGKRRIRCLQELNYHDIVGLDPRLDRRNEAEKKYKIITIGSLEEVNLASFDFFIISTPPDKHTHYAKIAVDYCKPAFVEASVLLSEALELKEYNKSNNFIAPSCTLRFHPIIRQITQIVKSGKFGKITNVSYHTGQYLPDWHPWESVNDFYVGNRITGGAREIVPFELTWLVDMLGFPRDAKGYFRKTMDFGAAIEDSYSCVFDYHDSVAMMTVDVTSRFATRSLLINAEFAQIRWNWEDGYFKIFTVEKNDWEIAKALEMKAEEGYNKNIGEKMYVEEIASFIAGSRDAKLYPNCLDDDIKVLKILEKIENSDGGFDR